MKAHTDTTENFKHVPVAPLVLASIILALGTVGAFAYMTGGSQLFVIMIENGLAWCF